MYIARMQHVSGLAPHTIGQHALPQRACTAAHQLADAYRLSSAGNAAANRTANSAMDQLASAIRLLARNAGNLEGQP